MRENWRDVSPERVAVWFLVTVPLDHPLQTVKPFFRGVWWSPGHCVCAIGQWQTRLKCKKELVMGARVGHRHIAPDASVMSPARMGGRLWAPLALSGAAVYTTSMHTQGLVLWELWRHSRALPSDLLASPYCLMGSSCLKNNIGCRSKGEWDAIWRDK